MGQLAFRVTPAMAAGVPKTLWVLEDIVRIVDEWEAVRKSGVNKDRVSSLYDVEHWRDRAEEARTLASQMTDPQTRTTMLQIAEGYETMARHAEVRRAKAKESN